VEEGGVLLFISLLQRKEGKLSKRGGEPSLWEGQNSLECQGKRSGKVGWKVKPKSERGGGKRIPSLRSPKGYSDDPGRGRKHRTTWFFPGGPPHSLLCEGETELVDSEEREGGKEPSTGNSREEEGESWKPRGEEETRAKGKGENLSVVPKELQKKN